MVAAAAMTARVLLAAAALEALQVLTMAIDSLAEVDDHVAVLLEQARHLLAALVVGKTAGNVDHDGMGTGGRFDTDGGNLNGT